MTRQVLLGKPPWIRCSFVFLYSLFARPITVKALPVPTHAFSNAGPMSPGCSASLTKNTFDFFTSMLPPSIYFFSHELARSASSAFSISTSMYRWGFLPRLHYVESPMWNSGILNRRDSRVAACTMCTFACGTTTTTSPLSGSILAPGRLLQ